MRLMFVWIWKHKYYIILLKKISLSWDLNLCMLLGWWHHFNCNLNFYNRHFNKSFTWLLSLTDIVWTIFKIKRFCMRWVGPIIKVGVHPLNQQDLCSILAIGWKKTPFTPSLSILTPKKKKKRRKKTNTKRAAS